MSAAPRFSTSLRIAWVDAPLHEELAAFLALVSALLQEKMGLSPQEATSYIENYGHDYFDRWGPTVMSWSKCKD